MATPHLTVKPATPRLNRGHPLSRDLVVCYAFQDKGGSAHTDIGDGHNDGSESSTGTYVESEYGGATSFAASVTHVDVPTQITLPTQETTVCVIYEKNDGTDRAVGLFGHDSGGSVPRIGVHGPFSDGVVYWDFGGNGGSNRLTTSSQTFERAVWVYTAGPRGMEIWKNGSLLASSATAVTRTAGGTGYGLGRHGGTTGDNVTYHLFALFDRQFEQSETIAFSADPFALIRPSSRLVVAFAPTAGSITGTGIGVIPAMVGVGVGVQTLSGTGVGIIPAMVGVGVGVETFSGTGVGIVPAMVGVGVGVQTLTGTGIGVVPSMVGVGTATVENPITGTGVGIIPAMVGVGVAVQTLIGTGVGVIPAMVGVGQAVTANNVGSGAGSIPAMVGVGVGAQVFTGTGVGSVPAMVGVGVGVEIFAGTGVGSIPAMIGVGVASMVLDIVGSGVGIIAAMVGVGVGNNGDGSITGIGVGAIPAMVGVGLSITGTLAENIAADLATFFGLSDFGEAATYIDRDGIQPDKPIQVVVDRAETLVLPETSMLAQESLIVHVPNDRTLGVTRIRTGDLITVAFRVGDTPSQKMITRVISSNTASFEVEVAG